MTTKQLISLLLLTLSLVVMLSLLPEHPTHSANRTTTQLASQVEK